MRNYQYTEVEETPNHRALRLAVAHALPSLTWRHHGIGVLQAYLTDTLPEVRVHIWHPRLARVGVEEEGRIHDHRFHLQSSVLFGSVHHDEYHLHDDPDGDWRLYTVINARKGAIDLPELATGSYRADVRRGVIEAGETYTFERGRFHASHVDGLAVTLVTKHDQQPVKARLLIPKATTPSHGMAELEPVVETFVAAAKAALLGESHAL